MNTPIETLCLGYPEEMATYMTYCRNLGFEETPNYAYLRRLFRDLYHKCQFEHDFIFDWTVQKYRVDEMPFEEGKAREGTSTILESLRNHIGNGSDRPNGYIDNLMSSTDDGVWAKKQEE